MVHIKLYMNYDGYVSRQNSSWRASTQQVKSTSAAMQITSSPQRRERAAIIGNRRTACHVHLCPADPNRPTDHWRCCDRGCNRRRRAHTPPVAASRVSAPAAARGHPPLESLECTVKDGHVGVGHVELFDD